MCVHSLVIENRALIVVRLFCQGRDIAVIGLMYFLKKVNFAVKIYSSNIFDKLTITYSLPYLQKVSATKKFLIKTKSHPNKIVSKVQTYLTSYKLC